MSSAYELYEANTAFEKRSDWRGANNTSQSKITKDSRSGDRHPSDVADTQTSAPTPAADEQPSPEELCRHFKATLSRVGVKVHFVGAWSVFPVNLKYVYVVTNAVYRDTVSSVGIIKGPTLPETTTGMTHVCTFRHALALDEVRVKFLPEYVNGGEGPRNEHGKAAGNVKEVWFAGSHSDM
jgi:uncharacterized protein (DUF2235 family)